MFSYGLSINQYIYLSFQHFSYLSINNIYSHLHVCLYMFIYRSIYDFLGGECLLWAKDGIMLLSNWSRAKKNQMSTFGKKETLSESTADSKKLLAKEIWLFWIIVLSLVSQRVHIHCRIQFWHICFTPPSLSLSLSLSFHSPSFSHPLTLPSISLSHTLLIGRIVLNGKKKKGGKGEREMRR